MNTCYVVRSSRPAGFFSIGLLDGLHVRPCQPYVREAPAGFGLERLATAFMNHPGTEYQANRVPYLTCTCPRSQSAVFPRITPVRKLLQQHETWSAWIENDSVLNHISLTGSNRIDRLLRRPISPYGPTGRILSLILSSISRLLVPSTAIPSTMARRRRAARCYAGKRQPMGCSSLHTEALPA